MWAQKARNYSVVVTTGESWIVEQISLKKKNTKALDIYSQRVKVYIWRNRWPQVWLNSICPNLFPSIIHLSPHHSERAPSGKFHKKLFAYWAINNMKWLEHSNVLAPCLTISYKIEGWAEENIVCLCVVLLCTITKVLNTVLTVEQFLKQYLTKVLNFYWDELFLRKCVSLVNALRYPWVRITIGSFCSFQNAALIMWVKSHKNDSFPGNHPYLAPLNFFRLCIITSPL